MACLPGAKNAIVMIMPAGSGKSTAANIYMELSHENVYCVKKDDSTQQMRKDRASLTEVLAHNEQIDGCKEANTLVIECMMNENYFEQLIQACPCLQSVVVIMHTVKSAKNYQAACAVSAYHRFEICDGPPCFTTLPQEKVACVLSSDYMIKPILFVATKPDAEEARDYLKIPKEVKVNVVHVDGPYLKQDRRLVIREDGLPLTEKELEDITGAYRLEDVKFATDEQIKTAFSIDFEGTKDLDMSVSLGLVYATTRSLLARLHNIKT